MEPTVEAGRTLDAMIAEKVMGWRRRRPDEIDWSERDWVRPDTGWFTDLPTYSTHIGCAWEVVNAMIERGALIGVLSKLGGWRVHVGFASPDDRNIIEYADTAAHAICLAALAAIPEPSHVSP